MTFPMVRFSAAALIALPLVLSGCSTKKKEPPPCPPIYRLGDAAQITKYRAGAGRDLTDVLYDAEVVGWQGDCRYKPNGDDWWVLLEITPAFEVRRGPANSSRKGEISYFVAIPAFYPAPEAKAEFTTQVEFPKDSDTVRLTDEPIRLAIPVKSAGVINNYEVYIGFQASPEELERNRRNK